MPYYMGDPGFFSTIGNIFKGVVHAIPGVGQVAGAIEGALVHKPKLPGVIPLSKQGLARAGTASMLGGVARTVTKHPVLTAAGAAGAIGALAGGVGTHLMAAGGACPPGHHISRSKHSKSFGACVRNRRMRVTNPRALHRALRRVGGFSRVARRVLHFTHPKQCRGRAHFKFPKRRRAA